MGVPSSKLSNKSKDFKDFFSNMVDCSDRQIKMICNEYTQRHFHYNHYHGKFKKMQNQNKKGQNQKIWFQKSPVCPTPPGPNPWFIYKPKKK